MKPIRNNFEILVNFGGNQCVPYPPSMIDAMRASGIVVTGSYEYYNREGDRTYRYNTYIDKEKRYSVENTSFKFWLLAHAIVNVLEECHIDPFVTVSIRPMKNPAMFPPGSTNDEIRMFSINEYHEILYHYS